MIASILRMSAHVACRRLSVNVDRNVIRGVIFDMDGTLTKSVIDFQEMRRRANIPTGDLLDVLKTLPPQRREEACKAIEDVELEALDKMELMPGLLEVCKYIDSKRVPRGLITRNVTRSVQHFHQHHFSLAPFLPALSREYEPYKPSPDAIHHICSEWGIKSSEVMMVGDSAKDDVVCGNRAGAFTVLLDEFGRYSGDCASLQGELAPSLVVKTMSELLAVLETKVVLEPLAGTPQPT